MLFFFFLVPSKQPSKEKPSVGFKISWLYDCVCGMLVPVGSLLDKSVNYLRF